MLVTVDRGIETRDSTSSNVIHCAIQHKIQPALFKQLLDEGRMFENIKQCLNLFVLLAVMK